jgi:transcription termination/antitermination protein NusA
MKIDMAALRAAESQRGVSTEAVLDAISTALLTAYCNTGGSQNAHIEINRNTGSVRVMAEEVSDGNIVSEWDDTPRGFGRIAVAAARQVIRNTPLQPDVKDELAERVYRMVRE